MPLPGANGRSHDGAGGRSSVEWSSASSYALAVIQRLQVCLDEETAVLGNFSSDQLVESNNRKGQSFMELTRAFGALSGSPRNPEVTRALESLRTKVDTNMKALRLHIAAVKEIALVLSDAIQNEESDGTYTASIQARWGGI